MQLYEEILGTSTEMLEAAQTEDWDRFVDLEIGCRNNVALLMAMPPTNLTAPAKRRKVEIIKQFLSNDARIRNIVEPGMAEMWRLISSTKRESAIQNAYQTPWGASAYAA